MNPTSKNEFQILFKYHWRTLTKRQQTALLKKKPKRWYYPIAIEHTYAENISNSMKTIVTSVLSRLEGRLATWMRMNDHNIRMDSPDEELEAILKEVEEEIAVMFTTGASLGAVFDYVESVANRIFGFEEIQWQSQIEVVLGVPLKTGAPWWPEARRLWVNENHRLIKSLSQEYITKLNTLLTTGFQSGWSYEEMVSAIQKLSSKITGYRARLIARDQVGKLQYAITRSQFESIGMDGYIWLTARDERVRGNPNGRYPKAVPSHWIMDDKVCKFSDPNVFSETGDEWLPRYATMPNVHPGQAILCRCTSTPYWLPVLREAIGSKL